MMPAAKLTLTHQKVVVLRILQRVCVDVPGCAFPEAIVAIPVEGHEVGRHDTWGPSDQSGREYIPPPSWAAVGGPFCL